MNSWYFAPTGATTSFEGGIWLQFIDGWHDWPGVMAGQTTDDEWHPAREAEMFSRELIQNFWDAALDQKEVFEGRGVNGLTPSIEFIYRTLSGPQKLAVAEALALDELVDRYRQIRATEQARTFRIDHSDFLTSSGAADLEVLIVRERYASGMYGVWDKQGRADLKAKMFYALVQSQGTDKSLETGGSFGKGKGAIALASRMRAVAAYTCFDRPTGVETDTATRRFLGVSYWTKHAVGNMETMGLGVLGNAGEDHAGIPSPWRDQDADEIAGALTLDGVDLRNPSEPADLGTTYVILDPSFGAADLARAVERNWWPALVAGDKFHVRIEDHDGESVPIAPRADTRLKPFVKAYELVLGRRPRGEDETMKSVETGELYVGELGLTADRSEDGFSFTDPRGPNNIVALIRNDMVIQYRKFTSSDRPPFVRGVFVVDREKNSEAAAHLARIEPVLHNNWPTQRAQGVEEEGRKLAFSTFTQIGRAVGDLIKRLTPESSTTPQPLPLVNQILGSLTENTGKRPPPIKPPRTSDPWSIHYTDREVAAILDGSQRQAISGVEIRLKDSEERSSIPVVVTFLWEVDEEGAKPRIEPLLNGQIELTNAESFEHVDVGKFQGELSHDASAFRVMTAAFRDDWTVHPSVHIEEAAAETGEEE